MPMFLYVMLPMFSIDTFGNSCTAYSYRKDKVDSANLKDKLEASYVYHGIGHDNVSEVKRGNRRYTARAIFVSHRVRHRSITDGIFISIKTWRRLKFTPKCLFVKMNPWRAISMSSKFFLIQKCQNFLNTPQSILTGRVSPDNPYS